ncbi:MAG: ABC transporter permease [Chitinivibrionales bacterium]|nr:ABC transporter permease [Chitinivibrionales bacterium]
MFERFIAFRYLFGKRRTVTWISAGGVCLGTFALVIALSIANGFEREVRDRIVGTLAHAKIIQYHGVPLVNYDSLRAIIIQQPGVVAAAPYITGKGGVEYDRVQEGVVIYGVEERLESSVTDLDKTIKYGKLSLDSARSDRGRVFPGVVLGLGLADKLGVRPGAELVVGSFSAGVDELDPTPRMARFTVSGIFETGMYEYDLNLVYVSIASAQKLTGMTGVEGIQIKTVDLYKADDIARRVKNALGGYPYTYLDWKSQNKSLFEWMRLEKIIIFIVISFIIIIAAFNIISSLYMMTLEKRREIGILMSMGSKARSIMRIFVLNGASIGFLGSTVGTLAGVALCLIQQHWRLIPLPGDIYFINKLPVLVQPLDVTLVYLAANIICSGATVYPAVKAAGILPAESIRYE